jgi:RES domain-containing protein
VKRRPRPPRIPSRAPAAAEGDAPALIELERFSQASLQDWRAAEHRLRQLHQSLFFGLEEQRQNHSAELIDALRSHALSGQPFENWARIVDYRYSNAPLSLAGSGTRIGGRFNIGAGINAAAFTSFPALYIAQDYETAFRERFPMNDRARKAELTAEELALRAPGSFTHVALRGQVETVIDVGDAQALKSFVGVLSEFLMPRVVRDLARRMGMRPLGLVRTASGLQRQLMHANWRAEPMQFDLPANSQVFGRIASAAGLHGILYPSSRNANTQCLALFPQNWAAGSSFVEVMGGAPSDARLTRIDGTTRAFQ